MNLAIIPARGGSKRIPRKNIKEFAGVPVIKRAINNANNSNLFDSIYVSSDDEEILEVAFESGAKILRREHGLADDYSTTIDVISDEISKLMKTDLEDSDFVSCIYPVTPLLNYTRVAEAISRLSVQQKGYVFSAKEFDAPVQRAILLNEDNQIKFISPTNQMTRTQDLERTFHDAGQFYVAKASTWVEKISIFSTQSSFIELSKYETLDIDDLQDWKYAEELFKIRDSDCA